MSSLALLFSGCGPFAKDKAGSELIKKAREDYTALDSAKVLMINTDTDEVEQEFTFKYDEKDVLTYSYYGKSENSEYAQYNNGAKCETYENGEFTHSVKGESGFSKYTRQITHPQADEGLLIYTPVYITDASVTEEGGITHVHHEYDAEKMGAEVENGTVTGFSADYYFDGEELLYFLETTTAQENGQEKVYSYKVEITEKNSVEKIEDPTKALKEAQAD